MKKKSKFQMTCLYISAFCAIMALYAIYGTVAP